MPDPVSDNFTEMTRHLLDVLEDRAEKARERRTRIIAECDTELSQIDAEREAVLTTDRIYRAVAADRNALAHHFPHNPPPPLPVENNQRPVRARIGPQRYRILRYLRSNGTASSVEQIADKTNLSYKRVQDQLRVDIPRRIVSDYQGIYELTNSGRDLLARFEAYTQAKGEPLPRLTGPIEDDASEDEEDIPISSPTIGDMADGPR